MFLRGFAPLLFALCLDCGDSSGGDASSSQGGGDDGGASAGGAPAGGAPSGGAPSAGGGSEGGAGPTHGDGVFLYYGNDGWGPGSYLDSDRLLDRLSSQGLSVAQGDALPADMGALGAFFILNPGSPLDAPTRDALRTFLGTGGRVVMVVEHCKNGCYGDEDSVNAILGDLGVTMRVETGSGVDYETVALDLGASPLVDGVTSLMAFFSGSVIPNEATVVGSDPQDAEPIVAAESSTYAPGEVVLIADSDPLGYVIDEGDNVKFASNLAHVP